MSSKRRSRSVVGMVVVPPFQAEEQ
jgi:hypothetical protein